MGYHQLILSLTDSRLAAMPLPNLEGLQSLRCTRLPEQVPESQRIPGLEQRRRFTGDYGEAIWRQDGDESKIARVSS
jgi:hypothetical protein